MPKAISRSKRPESLGRSAGARFTVILLLAGNSSPVFWIAERTRSRASFTSVSANPTSVKLGKPLARCTSTQTGRACRPNKARLCTKDKLIEVLSVKCLKVVRVACADLVRFLFFYRSIANADALEMADWLVAGKERLARYVLPDLVPFK